MYPSDHPSFPVYEFDMMPGCPLDSSNSSYAHLPDVVGVDDSI